MKRITLFVVLVLASVLGTACTPAPTPIPPTSTPVPPTTTPTATATPRPLGDLVLAKDFNNLSEPGCPTKTWSQGTTTYCQDGEYHTTSKETGSSWLYTGTNFKNFILQAQMRLVGEMGSYGVLFRMQNNPMICYIFLFRPSGRFQLIKYSEVKSQNAILVPWTDSTAIRKGQAANLIEVIAQGAQITLFANGEQLASVTDNSITEGAVGVLAMEQGHAAASSLKLWDLPR